MKPKKPSLFRFLIGVLGALLAFTCFQNKSLAVTFEDVLKSVDAYHPVKSDAQQKVQEAAGKRLSAAGSFDPTLTADGKRKIENLYDNTVGDVGVSQNLPWLGTKWRLFYKKGEGNFASYDEESKTSSEGEYGLKLTQPLLNGFWAGEKRYKLFQSEQKVQERTRGVNLTMLSLLKKAANSYFDWLSEYEKNKVARHLLELAEKRQQKLEKRVKSGDLPKILLTDNQRLILERQTVLIESDLKTQKAALELSLYFRTATGDPSIPSEPKEALESWSRNLTQWHPEGNRKLFQRPETQIFEIQEKVAKKEISLAYNQLLPELNIFGQVSRDEGYTDPNLNEPEYKVGLEFVFPIPTRAGRGRVMASKAKLDRIQFQKKWFKEKVSNSLQKSVLAVLAAQKKLQVSKSFSQASLQLENAENTLFRSGASDLIKLNIRESATAKADKEVINSQKRLIQSAISYWITLGYTNLQERLRYP